MEEKGGVWRSMVECVEEYRSVALGGRLWSSINKHVGVWKSVNELNEMQQNIIPLID